MFNSHNSIVWQAGIIYIFDFKRLNLLGYEILFLLLLKVYISRIYIYNVHTGAGFLFLFIRHPRSEELWYMIIAFVIDSVRCCTNGTVVTALRFKEELERRGHEVRICALGAEDYGGYGLSERYIPIVTKVSAKQQTYFAKPNIAAMREAFTGCDVVHFFLPWKLGQAGRKLAKAMNIPVCSAFHCAPENILYGARLRRIPFLNAILYRSFRRKFYRHFDNIHCPSNFIADVIKERGYKSKLHVISNGVCPQFCPDPLTVRQGGNIDIITVGRFAPEKRQDVIIRAVAKSKYKDKIILRLAGKGPLEKKLRKLAARLNVRAEFGFYDQPSLINVLRSSHLYIHAAEIEIEGISCIEAVACGTVPIISDSKRSAAGQFALDDRSLFKNGNSDDLAAKIDYYAEHESERAAMESEYAELGKKYSLNRSVSLAEDMFIQSIRDHRVKTVHAKTEQGKWMRKKSKRKNIIFRALSGLFYFGVGPFLYLINKSVYGIKIKNRRYLRELKKSGFITVCNHVHPLDSTMCALAAFPRKLNITAIRQNFGIPVAGVLVKAFGAIPVPVDIPEFHVFFYELCRRLNKGEVIHFFPEGELINYCDRMRQFKNGPFRLAVMSDSPILPLVITYRQRVSKRGVNKRPFFNITLAKPQYRDKLLDKPDAERKLKEDVENAMRTIESSDYYEKPASKDADKKPA